LRSRSLNQRAMGNRGMTKACPTLDFTGDAPVGVVLQSSGTANPLTCFAQPLHSSTRPVAARHVLHAVSRRRSPARYRACRGASRPALLACSSTKGCAAGCLANPSGQPSARRYGLRPKCVARIASKLWCGSPHWSGRPCQPTGSLDLAAPQPGRSISRWGMPSSMYGKPTGTNPNSA